MFRRIHLCWFATCLSAALAGCGEGSDDPVETRYFLGDVYDGVTGEKVYDYRIAVEYFGRRYAGSVNGNGGFELAGVPANHDYTVWIDAPGYRRFQSSNGQWLDEVSANRSFYYLAYLYNQVAQVQDVTLRIKLDDSAAIPAGSLRLRPIAPSSLMDDAIETPAAVGDQVWENDLDLLERSVWVDFENGVAEIPGSELVLGVTYQVTVLNVPGYQLNQTAAFQAGLDGDRTLVLSRLGLEPLQAVFVSTDSGNPAADGRLVVVFNQPVELDPRSTREFYEEVIDDAFSINAENTDGDMQVPSLAVDMSPTVQERGTSFTLEDERLVLEWSRDEGLATDDPQDVIRTITYGGFDQIRLRPVGGNAADVVTLADLVSSSVTVTVTP